jgi:integrase
LTGDRGHRFESQDHAEAILHQIRGLHARMPLSEAVAQYRQPRSRPNLVSEKVEEWIAHVETSGDYQPATIVRYRGYAEGHFAWWRGRSVYDVQYHALHQWITWLRERGQSDKSTKNILAAFRSFYTWLRRGRERDFPRLEFPRVKVRQRERRKVMDLMERAVAIAAIPAEDRGIFLALKMGIRPGEARALRIADYAFATGVVSITAALKSQGSGAVRGETKTGEVGDYPVSQELREWIAEQVPEGRRFTPDAPLFAHPRTGNPYSSGALRKLWTAACAAAEAEYIPLYRAMKHTTLTALREAGASIDDVRALARHRDARTTDIYDLSDDARRSRALDALDQLERGRQTGDRTKRGSKSRKPAKLLTSRPGSMVGVVGFEPTTLPLLRLHAALAVTLSLTRVFFCSA